MPTRHARVVKVATPPKLPELLPLSYTSSHIPQPETRSPPKVFTGKCVTPYEYTVHSIEFASMCAYLNSVISVDSGRVEMHMFARLFLRLLLDASSQATALFRCNENCVLTLHDVQREASGVTGTVFCCEVVCKWYDCSASNSIHDCEDKNLANLTLWKRVLTLEPPHFVFVVS